VGRIGSGVHVSPSLQEKSPPVLSYCSRGGGYDLVRVVRKGDRLCNAPLFLIYLQSAYDSFYDDDDVI